MGSGNVRLAPADYVQFSSTAEAEAQSRHDLIVRSLLAGMGIVLLLSVVLTHTRNLLLVLVNLPFALVGGVFAVFAGGGVLSAGAIVGFVTLFGITLRNSIMLGICPGNRLASATPAPTSDSSRIGRLIRHQPARAA